MTLRILYVDDEPDIREIAGLSLGLDPELDVRSCASGAEAVEQAVAWRPDLVLLDVMMPGMDGFEVCARLRATEAGKRLPIILLTGRDDVDTRLEGMQSGVSEFLAKPVTRHELLARVRAQLHILNLTRQLEQVEQNLKQRTGAAATATR